MEFLQLCCGPHTGDIFKCKADQGSSGRLDGETGDKETQRAQWSEISNPGLGLGLGGSRGWHPGGCSKLISAG